MSVASIARPNIQFKQYIEIFSSVKVFFSAQRWKFVCATGARTYQNF